MHRGKTNDMKPFLTGSFGTNWGHRYKFIPKHPVENGARYRSLYDGASNHCNLGFRARVLSVSVTWPNPMYRCTEPFLMNLVPMAILRMFSGAKRRRCDKSRCILSSTELVLMVLYRSNLRKNGVLKLGCRVLVWFRVLNKTRAHPWRTHGQNHSISPDII